MTLRMVELTKAASFLSPGVTSTIMEPHGVASLLRWLQTGLANLRDDTVA